MKATISIDHEAKLFKELERVETINITCCVSALKRVSRLAESVEKCTDANKKAQLCELIVLDIKAIKFVLGYDRESILGYDK